MHFVRSILFVVSIVIISFFSQCKKHEIEPTIPCTDPIQDSAISKSLMRGTWNWVSEYYVQPFTGNVFFKTPSTEGYTRKIVFLNESELQFFKNNTLQDKYKYDIEREKVYTNFPLDSTYVLVFKDYTSSTETNYVYFTVCSNTLLLNFQFRSDLEGQEKWSR